LWKIKEFLSNGGTKSSSEVLQGESICPRVVIGNRRKEKRKST
jgi:hypothetical protein